MHKNIEKIIHLNWCHNVLFWVNYPFNFCHDGEKCTCFKNRWETKLIKSDNIRQYRIRSVAPSSTGQTKKKTTIMILSKSQNMTQHFIVSKCPIIKVSLGFISWPFELWPLNYQHHPAFTMDFPKANFLHLFHSGILGASNFPDATAQKVPPTEDRGHINCYYCGITSFLQDGWDWRG